MRWEVIPEQDFQKDPGSISKWCGQEICDKAYMARYGMTEQEYANRHHGWPAASAMIGLQAYAWKIICERAGLTMDEFMHLCKLGEVP